MATSWSSELSRAGMILEPWTRKAAYDSRSILIRQAATPLVAFLYWCSRCFTSTCPFDVPTVFLAHYSFLPFWCLWHEPWLIQTEWMVFSISLKTEIRSFLVYHQDWLETNESPGNMCLCTYLFLHIYICLCTYFIFNIHHMKHMDASLDW